MAAIILNIFGLLLIVFSIFIIKRDLNQEEKYDDLHQIEENIKEYYQLTEEIVINFDNMIEDKITMLSNQGKEKVHEIKDENIDKTNKNLILREDSERIVDNLNPDISKILELQKIGLSKEEIARKLNKGIREIDIILKMQKYNKS